MHFCGKFGWGPIHQSNFTGTVNSVKNCCNGNQKLTLHTDLQAANYKLVFSLAITKWLYKCYERHVLHFGSLDLQFAQLKVQTFADGPFLWPTNIMFMCYNGIFAE